MASNIAINIGLFTNLYYTTSCVNYIYDNILCYMSQQTTENSLNLRNTNHSR